MASTGPSHWNGAGGFQWRIILTRLGRSGIWAHRVVCGEDRPGSDPYTSRTPALEMSKSLKHGAFSHRVDKPA